MSTTERRVVSVVFADLADFTALSERLDAEDVARIQDHYFARAAEVVAAHGGQVEKFIGDAVMATFGTAKAHDDDAVQAVRSASALLDAVAEGERELGVPPGTLRLRVGVETGEVVVTRELEGWRVTGDTVNTAARLQAAAGAGEVLLGPEAAFGVAHAFVVQAVGAVRLKGKAEAVPTWRVVEERPDAVRGLSLHGLHAPLLGRTEDLARVEAAVRGADADGPAALLVVAPPGVGKTRLVEEAARRASHEGRPWWTVLLAAEPDRGYGAVARLLAPAVAALLARRRAAGHAAAPADGVPDPAAEVDVDVVDALTEALTTAGYAAGHARVHAERTRALLDGAALEAEPLDLFTAWTAVLDAVPGPPPVWLLEDAHLAEPDLWAFLRHAVAHRRVGGPFLLLTARPTGGLTEAVAPLSPDVLHLEPLDPTVTERLVAHLVGPHVVPGPYLDGLVSASGGNPLFVEELLRSWIQSEVLRQGEAGWAFVGQGRRLVPTTVHAIYQGQLDALPPDSRAVVERGSVPGITFPVDALPTLGVTEPDPSLAHLTGAGLLRGPHEDRTGDAYTYRHALLRDTAYGSLARRDRAELHARFARWLLAAEGTGPGRGDLVGHHLALAAEALPATAPALADGTPVRALVEEAARLLEESARAHLVSSPLRAASLLRRTLDLPATARPDRLRRELLLAEAERRAGRVQAAMEAFAQAAQHAEPVRDVDAAVTAALGYENALFASRLPRDTWGATSVALLRAAESALPATATVDRSRVLAALGRALVYGGDPTGPDVCQRAVTLAEDAAEPRCLAEALLALRAAQAGPEHLTARLRSGARIATAAASTSDLELQLEVARLRLIDLLEAGDMVGADEVQHRATALAAELGRPLYFWYPPMWRAMRALLAGDLPAAEELVEAFRAEGRRAHYADTDLVWAIQRLRLHLDRGDVEVVADHMDALARRDPVRWGFAPALVRAHLGEHDAARDALGFYARDRFTGVVRDLSWAATMAHLAEAATILEDAGAAADIARLLAPWAGHLVVIGSGALCLGSASHHLGIALATAGEHEEARAHLADAVATNDVIGAPGLAARSRAALARTLLHLGRPDEAAVLRARAHEAARGLGMVALAEATSPPSSHQPSPHEPSPYEHSPHPQTPHPPSSDPEETP